MGKSGLKATAVGGLFHPRVNLLDGELIVAESFAARRDWARGNLYLTSARLIFTPLRLVPSPRPTVFELAAIRVIKLERDTRWAGFVRLGSILDRPWQLTLNVGTTAPFFYVISERFVDALKEQLAAKVAPGETG